MTKSKFEIWDFRRALADVLIMSALWCETQRWSIDIELYSDECHTPVSYLSWRATSAYMGIWWWFTECNSWNIFKTEMSKWSSNAGINYWSSHVVTLLTELLKCILNTLLSLPLSNTMVMTIERKYWIETSSCVYSVLACVHLSYNFIGVP